jgi:hypothetical protein
MPFDMFRKDPEPLVLLQQAAYGVAAAVDQSRPAGVRPEVIVDLLEEVFQCVSDQKTVTKYTPVQAQYGLGIKKLQFAIMRMLCVLYREVRAAATQSRASGMRPPHS